VSRIYWDTMLFIYWTEEHPQYADRVAELHSRMMTRGDTLCTSVFTAGEVLCGLYRTGAAEQARQIKEFFNPPNVEMLPFNLETADRYAQIRGKNKVSPADAVHLATAAESQTTLFLTNDDRLKRLVIAGIDFIAGLDVDLF